jgi:hypothetical protein
MMHTAGMSPKFSSLVGSSPRICEAMFSAATWAMVSAGNPVDVGQLWWNRTNTEDVEPRLLVERGRQRRAVLGIIKE